MLTLAIELSSNHGSVALVNEAGTVAERAWSDCVRERQTLFDSIKAIMTESGTGWDDIEFYTVGRGPGSFSGLRVASAVARALAMPDDKPVIAVSSGEALARAAIALNDSCETVAAIGDARRQMCWIGVFNRNGHVVEQTVDYALVPYGEIGAHIPAGALVVTSEWDRLDQKVAEQCPEAMPIKRNVYPSAAVIGQLGLECVMQEKEREDLEPLYMHPPVFVEPKYA
jgi:tRNA threonylcarbamoyl adenosine modification protein YeaZ